MRNLFSCLVVVLLVGCGDADATKEGSEGQAVSEPAAPEPVPLQHNYALKEGYSYGYEAAISEEDKAKGVAAKPLSMWSYAGEKDGKYQIFHAEDGAITAFECGDPCEFLKAMVFTDEGEHVKTERLRAEPGMIAALAIEDAKHGFLDRAGLGTDKSDVQWAWFTEKGIRFTKPTAEERTP